MPSSALGALRGDVLCDGARRVVALGVQPPAPMSKKLGGSNAPSTAERKM
jgi:hypothetical protein